MLYFKILALNFYHPHIFYFHVSRTRYKIVGLIRKKKRKRKRKKKIESSWVSREKKKTSYIVMYASKLTRSTNRAPDLEHPGAHARKLILRRDAHSRVKRKVDRVSIGRALHGVTCDAFLIRRSIFSTREIFSTKKDNVTTNNRKVKLPVLYYRISDYPFSRGKSN